MDFETIQFTVPEWAGTRPYQQIPFQWSCHEEAAGGSMRHHEFLAEGNTDPRRAFAESLISRIGARGPVIVYNAAFEKRILQETSTALPDLAVALYAVHDRIFDLLPVTRKHNYHPDMRGSWSLKNVLPTVAPELDYAGLAVSHGGEAQSAFLKMLALPCDAAERAALRRNLLDYCERDTLAMVRILHFLGSAGSRP